MYNQSLHRDRKHICRYCFQSFSTTKILEKQANDCLEFNDKQMAKMVKKE